MLPRHRPEMPPMSKEQERQRRVSLIAMYVLGVGVGCVLVGVILKAKRAALGPAPSPALTAPATPTPGVQHPAEPTSGPDTRASERP